MDHATVETLLLLSVSAMWYCSIACMVVRRRAAPKRPAVVTVLLSIYLAGMAMKLSLLPETGELGTAFWLYGFNLFMVLLDLQLTTFYSGGHYSLRDDEDLRPLQRIAPPPSRAAAGA